MDVLLLDVVQELDAVQDSLGSPRPVARYLVDPACPTCTGYTVPADPRAA
jgi:hypothetical protein